MTSVSLKPAAAAGTRFPEWLAALSTPLWLVPLWLCLPATPLTTLTSCLTLALLAACTYADVRWGGIPNAAVSTALVLALAVAALQTVLAPGETAGPPAPRWAATLGAPDLGESVAGALVALALMLIAYRLAGGSAGDVKLGTALGALLGPAAVLEVLLWAYVLAGVTLVGWALLARGPLALAGGLGRRLGSRVAPARVGPPSVAQAQLLEGKVPLSPFFAAGTLAVLAGAPAVLATAFRGG